MVIRSFKNFYRQRFRGQIFVIKAGGRIISDNKARENLLKNIQEMTKDGIRILLIYGGGHAIDDALEQAGNKPYKINGRRITSKNDIRYIKHVLCADLGSLITETASKLGLAFYGLQNVPTNWTEIKQRPKHNNKIRYDGEIKASHVKNIKQIFTATRFVFCPCIGQTKDGLSVNINADNVAINLAAGIKAAKLILLTDVDGVIVNKSPISVITAKEIENLIDDGTVTDGMRVKMENCVDALRAGVKRVHILNGFKENVLRNEVYTSQGAGTMIVRNHEKKRYEKEEVKGF